MALFFISFLAGALTILAPCVLPVLPVIVGGASTGRKRNPYIITLSLAAAIVIFTLALKYSTTFINVPEAGWRAVSGILIITFGLISLFPIVWESINARLELQSLADAELSKAGTSNAWWSDVLLGVALGPVFSSCSPTYFIILASVLPVSLALGTAYLAAYALGLAAVLLPLSLLGQKLIKRFTGLANPRGWFKRTLGALLVIVGALIASGFDRPLQTYLVDAGIYPTGALDTYLAGTFMIPRTSNTTPQSNSTTPRITKNFPRYREIANPSGFVNSQPFSLGDLVGKKVILVDFMTYSCINCIRTFPYLTAWYQKYKDAGLEIVGIHTPEFAFERKYENVVTAMKQYNITFPVVLDNDYGTWSSYQNNYWPRKYLIDIDGYIVYDHIGEGNYGETEAKIQELLRERTTRLGATTTIAKGAVVKYPYDMPAAQSPETYFGAARNQYLQNASAQTVGIQQLTRPKAILTNALYLVGPWSFTLEYAASLGPGSVIYRYKAGHVYFVASGDSTIKVEVLRDGLPLTKEQAGSDVIIESGRSYLIIKEERLYSILNESAISEHNLELIIPGPGLNAYTFTFG